MSGGEGGDVCGFLNTSDTLLYLDLDLMDLVVIRNVSLIACFLGLLTLCP
jgi:hypothetical protein